MATLYQGTNHSYQPRDPCDRTVAQVNVPQYQFTSMELLKTDEDFYQNFKDARDTKDNVDILKRPQWGKHVPTKEAWERSNSKPFNLSKLENQSDNYAGTSDIYNETTFAKSLIDSNQNNHFSSILSNTTIDTLTSPDYIGSPNYTLTSGTNNQTTNQYSTLAESLFLEYNNNSVTNFISDEKPTSKIKRRHSINFDRYKQLNNNDLSFIIKSHQDKQKTRYLNKTNSTNQDKRFFNVRSTNATIQREKTIQKKLLDLQQISKANIPFKSRPIPKSTTQPKYQEMVEMNKLISEYRRTTRREEMLNEITPFLGVQERTEESIRKKEKLLNDFNTIYENELLNTQFKANIVDPNVIRIENGEIKRTMYGDNIERKARIAKRASETLAKSHFPPRLELHMKLKELQLKEESLINNITNNNNINYDNDEPKERITQPRPFSFDNPKSSRYQEIKEIHKKKADRQLKQAKEMREKEIQEEKDFKKKMENISKSEVKVQPKSTNSLKLYYEYKLSQIRKQHQEESTEKIQKVEKIKTQKLVNKARSEFFEQLNMPIDRADNGNHHKPLYRYEVDQRKKYLEDIKRKDKNYVPKKEDNMKMNYVPPELRYIYLKDKKEFEISKIQKLLELQKQKKNRYYNIHPPQIDSKSSTNKSFEDTKTSNFGDSKSFDDTKVTDFDSSIKPPNTRTTDEKTNSTDTKTLNDNNDVPPANDQPNNIRPGDTKDEFADDFS